MVKNYNCKKCGKKFNQKFYYDDHIKNLSCIIESKEFETIQKIVDDKVNNIIEPINESKPTKTYKKKKNIIKPIIEQVIEPIVEPIIEQVNESKPTKTGKKKKNIIKPIIEQVIEQVNESKPTKTCKKKKNIIKPIIEQVIEPIVEPIIEPIVEPIIEPIVEHIIEQVNENLNVLDLFCGCGGMSNGLREAGLNIIAGIDIWDKAIDNYKKNYHHKAICADLTKLPPDLFCKTYEINKNIDIIVGGPPCFISGTKVLTDSKYKNIENVTLEDKLLTHTGKFQKIINLQIKIYSGDLYELDIKYHPELIICTQEHPFFVREKKIIWDNSIGKYKTYFDEPIWKNAQDLTLNDYYGMVINNNEIIPEINNIKLNKKEYWFLIGYYVANGSIVKSKTSYSENIIYFSIPDKFLENILLQIRKILPITIKNTDTKNESQCKTYECDNKLWFQIFEMFDKYTYDKLIPEWVQDAPKEFIQEFINGYNLTNENENINDKDILQLTKVYYNIAYGLQRLYLKLGYLFEINKCICPKTCVIEGVTEYQQDIYSIKVYLTKESNVSSFIENNYVWYEPSKINKKKTLNTQVYNFEVENDNSYIVSNTICHNCQSFSIAGRRDKNDPRNSLFMEFVKYLDYFNPKAFIMENVIGILSKKTETNEKVIDIIMTNLIKNYNCIICKLYASDFEVPQNRRRAIIIGVRKDLNIIPEEPKIILEVEKRIPVKTILLQKEEIDKSYYLSQLAIEGIKKKKLKSVANGFGFGAQYLDLEKPSFTIPARYHKDGYDALVKYSDTEIRRLTILELKRIQSFPDNYILEGSKKDIITQIGNAVACRFAFHLGKYIKKLLNNNYSYSSIINSSQNLLDDERKCE